MTWRIERYRRQMAPVADTRGIAPCVLMTALLGLALGPGTSASPAGLSFKEETAAAFDKYVKLTNARIEEELRTGTRLLWIDVLPEGERSQAYEALKRGDVKMQRLETRENEKKISCPG